MRQKSARRRVVVVVPYANKAAREFFDGVLRYSHLAGRWKIRVHEKVEEFTPEVVASLADTGTDGIIAFGLSSQKTADALSSTRIPLVVDEEFANHFTGTFRPSCVGIDEGHIGEVAANYLFGLGNFHSFGVVPCRDDHLQTMSNSRCHGFIRRMNRNGITPEVFVPKGDWISSLGEWLLSLGLPAAVFAPIDRHGREILNACENVGLSSPDQVCVLGAADDERYCLTSSPELSSVTTGCEQEGYVAARELARLMRNGKGRKAKTIVSRSANHVVERESTASILPATSLIQRSIEFIKAHADQEIRVQDVAAEAKVSRRLLEMRFKQIHGETINETIVRERLNHFCRRLRDSKASITAVARLCGFKNMPYLSTLFKRRFGDTIRAWRQKRTSR